MEGVEVERRHAIQTAEKLHQIADAIASGKSFHMKIDGRRLAVPPDWLDEFEITEHENSICLRYPEPNAPQ